VATERQRAVATCLQLYDAPDSTQQKAEIASLKEQIEKGGAAVIPSANWAAGRRSGRVARRVMELVAGSCGGLSRPVVRAAHDDDLADAGVTQARGDAGIKLLVSCSWTLFDVRDAIGRLLLGG
jgi:hypothetical protein